MGIQITSFKYYPEACEAQADITLSNGYPTFFHMFDVEGGEEKAIAYTHELGELLETNLDKIYAYLVSRFLQLRNDILPLDAEPMDEDEFIYELGLAGLNACYDGDHTIWFNSGELFDENMIIVYITSDFEITDAEISR